MRIISQIVTWLFMPILMPIYALLLVMYIPSEPIKISDGNSLYNISQEGKVIFLNVYAFFTIISPALMYLFMLKKNVIHTVQLDDKSERKQPMLFMSLLCFVLYIVLVRLSSDLSKYIYGLALSGGVIIMLFTFLNKYFKVSLHATGVGILTGFIFAYISDQIYFQFWVPICVLLISGLVLSSRLYLKKHTPIELISGYFISLIITFILNLYYPF